MLSLSQYHQYEQGASPNQFITSTCLYPKKINIIDSLGKNQTLYVKCGHCIRCSDDSREQWVSRMSLHSLCYKHCYFVTLTYGSYNLFPYDKHPFKEDWLLTKPRLSNKNSTKRFVYQPTLLRQEHLTKFLKRLRIIVKSPITYCACGEYGEKYLRPHFHLILWCDDVISYENICNAWSYLCYAQSPKCIVRYNGKQTKKNNIFSFFIGKVDFHDLVSNGTLNFDAIDNTKYAKSRSVFSYVAKYVCKQDGINPRIKDQILSAFYQFDHTPFYSEKSDNDNVTKSLINEHRRSRYFGFEPSYNNTLAAPFLDEFGGICITLKHNQKIYEKVTKDEFVKIFSPFFVSSRAVAIGRPYYEQNFERFQAKCYDLPKFHNKTLVFPRYFQRLLKNEKYPIYFKKHSLFSTSYSRDFLPCVRDFYQEFAQDKSTYLYLKKGSITKKFGLHKYSSSMYLSPTFIDNNGLVTYYYSPLFDIFEGFKYDRHTKSYEFYEYIDRQSFCSFVISNLTEQIKDLTLLKSKLETLCTFNELLLEVPQRQSIIEEFTNRRQEMSSIYKLQKNFFSTL